MRAGRASSPEIHTGVYRQLVAGGGLVRFRVRVEESDLLISAREALEAEAYAALRRTRAMIVAYAAAHEGFYASLTPLPLDESAPPVVDDMLRAGQAAGVGPMAAVAGAIAQQVGEALLPRSGEVIVENGGDVYLRTDSPPTLCILAESAPVGCLHVRPALGAGSLGICTSSGKLGPSLSLGKADAVTVLAPRVAVADALATRLANEVHTRDDVAKVLEHSRSTEAQGVVIIMEDCIGAWGALRIVA